MSKRSKNQAKKKRQRARKKRRHLLQVKTCPKGSTPPPEAGKDDSTQRTEVSIDELKAILTRAEKGPLSKQDGQLLLSALQTLHFLTEQLEKKSISIARLRKLLFGASTETSKNLGLETSDQDQGDSQDENTDNNGESAEPKEKRKGHGRNGADTYTGAKKVKVTHQTLKPGDSCPTCHKGTVYETKKPGHIVRVRGQAPLNATVYELQKLRCGLCGKVFTAEAPKDIGDKKYDAESASMIALLKYGSGVPFNRLDRLQGSLGIPLPASTQWDILKACEPIFIPVHKRLIWAAAQGKILHNDDTGIKVIDPTGFDKPETEGQPSPDRKGLFTSGVVSVGGGHRIGLFFTGRKHAGENLADVLKQRAEALGPPIQMCDALAQNMSADFKAILCNCLSHGRRRFVDIIESFPSECRYVLELLAKVYKNDAITREKQLSDDERLHYHQTHSGPLMGSLKDWMSRQFEEKLVEPNSGLGEAITYMLKHWKKLTLFLRQPGAPLDNNICERALKKAILHRKNAYFYKTANGARVGDMFMSLIHTCELNKVNPFDYLTELQKHTEAVALYPAAWMPWNYQQTMAATKAADDNVSAS